jgi:nucleotide-binding universal stress UspA family protein
MNTATKPVKSLQAIREPVWINNILFLTDFSPVSTVALQHALSVARRFAAKVYVTHVVEPAPAPPLASGFYEAVVARKEAEKKFGELLDEGQLNSVLHEIILREGALLPVVDKMVREKNVDLIVMGTHGRKGFRKMVLGSFAEEVYRKANCPVLTIGPENPANPQKEMRPRRILLATDLRDRAHRACDYAIAMARRHGAELIVFHAIEDRDVSDFGRAEQQRLAALARLEGLIPREAPLASEPKLLVVRGNAAEEILRLACGYEVDLIVIGLHAVKRMAGYLPGTVAYRVVCSAPCPVLTVPAGAQQ